MEHLLMTYYSKDDLKSIIKECLQQEIQEIKMLLKSKDEEKHLTTKDLSVLFGVSKITIRQWVKNGVLTGYKVGNRRIYFKKEDIEAALKNQNLSFRQRTKLLNAKKYLQNDISGELKFRNNNDAHD